MPHRHLNKIIKTIGTMGVALLHTVVMCFVLRWNVKSGIKNRGDPDFGHFSLSKQRRVAKLEKEMGMELHTPRLPPEDMEITEHFGAAWRPKWLSSGDAAVAATPAEAGDMDGDAVEDPGLLEEIISVAMEDGRDLLGNIMKEAAAGAATTCDAAVEAPPAVVATPTAEGAQPIAMRLSRHD